MSTHPNTRTHTYARAHSYTKTQAYTHTQTHTQNTYTHTYIHTRTHRPTNTHTHTHTRARARTQTHTYVDAMYCIAKQAKISQINTGGFIWIIRVGWGRGLAWVRVANVIMASRLCRYCRNLRRSLCVRHVDWINRAHATRYSAIIRAITWRQKNPMMQPQPTIANTGTAPPQRQNKIEAQSNTLIQCNCEQIVNLCEF
jgi:hypothetical protein